MVWVRWIGKETEDHQIHQRIALDVLHRKTLEARVQIEASQELNVPVNKCLATKQIELKPCNKCMAKQVHSAKRVLRDRKGTTIRE